MRSSTNIERNSGQQWRPSESREVPLIAHIIFRLDVGGLENGLVNLINTMPSGSYRHAIICLKDSTSFSDRIESSYVPVYEIAKKDGKDPDSYRRLWRVMRNLSPDVVHTRNANTLEYQLIAALAGVRFRVHGEHGWDLHDLHGASVKYRLLRRLMAPFVDQFVVVSRDLERYLTEKIGIDSRKIKLIHNGVDANRFCSVQSGAYPEIPVDWVCESTVVVGTVGRFQAVKNQTLLVRAFVQLVERFPQLKERMRLLMVGDGPLFEDIREEVKRAGIDDLVWMPGQTDKVPSMMSLIDIFALPSLNEGISNTILEAMASAIPVIATNVGGSPEIVEHNKTGMLIAPGDVDELAKTILTYVEDEELRRLHGAQARTCVSEKFSLSSMVEGYMKVYDGLTGERSVARRKTVN